MHDGQMDAVLPTCAGFPRLRGGLVAGGVVTLLAWPVATAAANPVRDCGELPATQRHNGIADITARGVSCRTARAVTLDAFFSCRQSGCEISGSWRCRIYSREEDVTMRCVRGSQTVGFRTGS
jgi:hypothetical protein